MGGERDGVRTNVRTRTGDVTAIGRISALASCSGCAGPGKTEQRKRGLMTKPFKMDLLCSIVLERIVPVMMVGGAWKGKGAGKREGLVQTWVFAC